MKKLFLNLINIDNKELKAHNMNFFYLTTIIVSTLLVLVYLFFNQALRDVVAANEYMNFIIMPLTHSNWGHLIGNVLSFVVVSIFLERYFGSLKYLSLIVLLMPLTSALTFMYSGHMNWIGASGLVYFLFGVMFGVLIIHIKTVFHGKQKWFNFIIMAMLFVIMSYTGELSALFTDFALFFKFSPFKDFYDHTGHFPNGVGGFIIFLSASILIRPTILHDLPKKEKIKKEKVKKEKRVKNKNTDGANQVVQALDEHAQTAQPQAEQVTTAPQAVQPSITEQAILQNQQLLYQNQMLAQSQAMMQQQQMQQQMQQQQVQKSSLDDQLPDMQNTEDDSNQGN